ncbi:helix-turn-helix domain-containing protein [Pseudophaeobacter flagellatus]|uniref:helix-turn-helix domain-containing protein n=1 Tax=Pseudophaeobacter flagellatus TaxID=2899119 RepID=UPI001E3A5F1C|nr:helix-turn-helix domain-containing protein [Pseudophaeobacter flagellatus]MCD9147859.1 helix-turn-helix domain-containing protein [Pseudophaeobacter flagellatus]
MRGKKITENERIAILVLLSKGHSRRFIAKALNRSLAGIQGQIDAMRAQGLIECEGQGAGNDKQ